ncbi:YggT family protein [Candidatus Acidulodesulfobacterium sp. H_13]|uniref:YggT family protein n=1 Tax=Candidatus Acidulodesulfobacterium sp. H_13 TaxID=3395470 RepID=UPI003AF664E9
MLLFSFVRYFFDILSTILTVYMWIIIIKALLSWVNPDPYNQIVRLINDITEPVLNKIRLILPLGTSFAFDFSPVIVILIILIIQFMLNYIEFDYILPLIIR